MSTKNKDREFKYRAERQNIRDKKHQYFSDLLEYVKFDESQLKENEKINNKIYRLFLLTSVILLFTLILAMSFYTEGYDFIGETISGLGGIKTYDLEIQNYVSMVIFSGGVVICGILSFWNSALYFRNKLGCNTKTRAITLLVMGIGAMGLAVPRDLAGLQILHYLGALLFIGSFDFLMACIYSKKELPIIKEINKMDNIRKSTRVIRISLDLTWIIFLWIILVVYAGAVVVDKFIPVPANVDAFFEQFHIIVQKVILITVVLSIHLVEPEFMDCIKKPRQRKSQK